jgi:hypothetical protein
MSENIKILKDTENVKFSAVGFWIILSILFLFASLGFFLFSRRKILWVRPNSVDRIEIEKELNSLREKNAAHSKDITMLLARISELSAEAISLEKRLVALENQTTTGQDRNVKIILNLNRIQKLIEDGEDFSENLHFLEKLSQTNPEQRELISRIENYRDVDLSDAKIMKIFSGEVSKMVTIKFSDRKFRQFIESNVRIIKISGKDYKRTDSFTDTARKYIIRHNYSAFRTLVEQNGYDDEIFRETLTLIAKREELNRLVDSLSRAIYYYE